MDSALALFLHFSPGAPSTSPEFCFGHWRVLWRCLSAHWRICLTLSLGRPCLLRTPRFFASSCASEEPPGRPRPPLKSTLLILPYLSPAAPATSPDFWFGHRPVLRWCTPAQSRICSTVRFGSAPKFRTPRLSSSSCASEDPPGRPRRPMRSAFTMFLHSSPGAPSTSPDVLHGHSPRFSWCASAHLRTCLTVRSARAPKFRTPRFSASCFASEEPPGRPRPPRRS